MSNLWHTLLPKGAASRRLIVDFADRNGLVYFGYVSQRSDEHHIVRGVTVSTKHRDDHYCIGTFEGYDVIFVERSDTLRSGKQHTWHIMEFDLKSNIELPHVFFSSKNQTHGFHELLDLKHRASTETALGATTAPYPSEFSKHFVVRSAPEDAMTVELIIPQEVAGTIASHFKGLAVEIVDQSLYVYSEQPHLSSDLLDTMLQNGTWLSSALDKNSRSL